jgi:hypothetical protein
MKMLMNIWNYLWGASNENLSSPEEKRPLINHKSEIQLYQFGDVTVQVNSLEEKLIKLEAILEKFISDQSGIKNRLNDFWIRNWHFFVCFSTLGFTGILEYLMIRHMHFGAQDSIDQWYSLLTNTTDGPMTCASAYNDIAQCLEVPQEAGSIFELKGIPELSVCYNALYYLCKLGCGELHGALFSPKDCRGDTLGKDIISTMFVLVFGMLFGMGLLCLVAKYCDKNLSAGTSSERLKSRFLTLHANLIREAKMSGIFKEKDTLETFLELTKNRLQFFNEKPRSDIVSKKIIHSELKSHELGP